MIRESHRRIVHTAMLLLLAGALYGTLAFSGAESDGVPALHPAESAVLSSHAAQPEARLWFGCLGLFSSL